MNLTDLVSEIEPYAIAIRRHMHENPEVSLQEFETIAFICKELDRMGIPYEVIEKGGIIATIEGYKKGKTLILRADFDALPMDEASTNLHSNKQVVSKKLGAAHTCGHDAHTAILLATAKLLSTNLDQLEGTILLAFEQAEEIGGGVYRMVKRLHEIGADGIWGLHLKSDLQSGKISIEDGPRMAATSLFHVKLKGKSGHGSRPDLAIHPLNCFTEFYNGLQLSRLNYLNPYETITYSVGMIQAGSTPNLIPDDLSFSGTIRYLHVQQGQQAIERFKFLLNKYAELHGCTYEFVIEPNVADTVIVNHPICSEIALEALSKELDVTQVVSKAPAWMASETYSFYIKYFPSVFAFLGIQNETLGSGAEHHNAHFDMDESALALGIHATVRYALDFLSYQEHIPFEAEQLPPYKMFVKNGSSFLIPEEEKLQIK